MNQGEFIEGEPLAIEYNHAALEDRPPQPEGNIHEEHVDTEGRATSDLT